MKKFTMKLRFLPTVVENRENSEQNTEFSEFYRSGKIFTLRSNDIREKLPVSSL